jgi:hypothetical protein
VSMAHFKRRKVIILSFIFFYEKFGGQAWC